MKTLAAAAAIALLANLGMAVATAPASYATPYDGWVACVASAEGTDASYFACDEEWNAQPDWRMPGA